MNKRSSGILMHISSLAGKYGIGDFGQGAYDFVDFLAKSKQRYWQILPLGPTGFGDSPYQSFSSYAGNWYFIDLDEFVAAGYLSEADIEARPLSYTFDEIDYGLLYHHKLPLLWQAYESALPQVEDQLKQFMKGNFWVRDFALYMTLKKHHDDQSWLHWSDVYRDYHSPAVLAFEASHEKDIYFYVFTQYYFFKQWNQLKAYAHQNQIKIIGDLPIYVSEDSCDMWANPHLFQVDENLKPTSVAGYPPDNFSKEGQLWGNPLYAWEAMKADGYTWWIQRIQHAFSLVDVLRIDHFMGFETYWAIPYGSKNAIKGQWQPGPGKQFFQAIKDQLGQVNIIAEDLGLISDAVRELIEFSGYPGMKVLQFAFNPHHESEYLPHNHPLNSVVYTGTHDNPTIMSWLMGCSSIEFDYVKAYLKLDEQEPYYWSLIRAAWASRAKLAVVPFADFLGLLDKGRMNEPSTFGKNWRWRIQAEALSDELALKIKQLSMIYHRNKD